MPHAYKLSPVFEVRLISLELAHLEGLAVLDQVGPDCAVIVVVLDVWAVLLQVPRPLDALGAGLKQLPDDARQLGLDLLPDTVNLDEAERRAVTGTQILRRFVEPVQDGAGCKKHLPFQRAPPIIPHLGQLLGHDLGLDPAPELLIVHCKPGKGRGSQWFTLIHPHIHP